MITVGQIGLALGLVGMVLAVISLLIGHLGGRSARAVTRLGYYLSLLGTAGFTLASLTLTAAFFAKDYSIYYVASNHTTDVSSLSWLYTLSGLWAGREGSLLFWSWMMTLFSGYVVFKTVRTEDRLSNVAIIVMNTIVAIFGLAMVLTEANNPFVLTPAEYYSNGQLIGMAASWGMNPVLQHWAMIFHPPTLFVGYAGLVVPFAFAIGALVTGDSSPRWIEKSDRITMFSWLFLGGGIGLGAIWAYVVLGWGGFWGWDPVENASILPWFVGLAMLHSFTMYRRRDGFKRWAIMLAALTFSMVILGTFITRSGLVQSVHAFAPDETSFWLFLILIIGPIILGAGLLIWRWRTFSGNDDFESLTGREAAYYFNNVIMTIASLLIAYMTVSSALPKWMLFGGDSLGPISYELIARPVGILYLMIVALCPLLSWGSTGAKALWAKLQWPLVWTVALFALLSLDWWFGMRPVWADMVAAGGEGAREFNAFGPQWVYDVLAVLGLLTASFTIMNNGALFVRGTVARAKAMGESYVKAFWSVLTKARTQSGGYLAHIAMGLIVIGLVGSSMYVRDVSATLPVQEGESVSIAEYKFVFTGIDETTLENGDVHGVANFTVYKNGKEIDKIEPSMTTFATQGMTRLNASIAVEPLRDVFFVFQGINGESNTMSINVKINPLIWSMWTGFGLLLIGTALAAWPKRRAVSA